MEPLCQDIFTIKAIKFNSIDTVPIGSDITMLQFPIFFRKTTNNTMNRIKGIQRPTMIHKTLHRNLKIVPDPFVLFMTNKYV